MNANITSPSDLLSSHFINNNTTVNTISSLVDVAIHLKSEIVVLFIVFGILVSKILSFIWRKIFYDCFLHSKINRLEREIKVLQKKSAKYNTPSLFAKYAKMQRSWKLKEKMLSEMKSSRSYWIMKILSIAIQQILSYAFTLICIYFWYGRVLFSFPREEFCCLSSASTNLCIPEFLCSSQGYNIGIIPLIVLSNAGIEHIMKMF
ncbi:hypothetical protein ABK040_002149 [Willaertia magna]